MLCIQNNFVFYTCCFVYSFLYRNNHKRSKQHCCINISPLLQTYKLYFYSEHWRITMDCNVAPKQYAYLNKKYLKCYTTLIQHTQSSNAVNSSVLVYSTCKHVLLYKIATTKMVIIWVKII